MNILLQNIAFLVRNPGTIEQSCDLLIKGDRIEAIGKNLPVPENTDIVDATGCIVIPGLINAHTHLYQNFLKGVARDETLIPWINSLLFPSVAAIREQSSAGNERPAYLWTAAASIEMIRGGVTCCVNMDVISDESMAAWRDLGMRGVCAYTLTNTWVPAELRGEEMKTRQKVAEFIRRWHQPGGLLQVFPAPSTPYLCDDAMLQWIRDLAKDMGLGIHIHVSEIASEVQDSLRDWGKRPFERLNDLGLLAPNLSAVHCVHISPQEIALLADTGVNVVHCPKSNMKLADGVMPILPMKHAGIPISVATDGCGSNDLLDMWEEMRAGAMLARVTNNDAAALTAEEVLRMATIEPAKVCGIQAGQLEPGLLADLAVIEPNGAHIRPLFADRLIQTLVFCGKAADVRDTIINGEFVMRNRRIVKVDEQQVLAEADRVGAQLYNRRGQFQY